LQTFKNLEFLFEELAEQDNTMSNLLLVQLKVEIGKRRDKLLVSLLRFLADPNSLTNQSVDPFFAMSSKSEIIKTAKTFMRRFFGQQQPNDISNEAMGQDATVSVNDASQNVTVSRKRKLELKIQQSIGRNLKKPRVGDDDFDSISKEVNIYAVTGKITENLKNLKEALSTIRPTSTDNERNFSTSGNFVSKKRTAMSDESIDCLCFLKAHFLKRRKL
jgi:hypothetical protein